MTLTYTAAVVVVAVTLTFCSSTPGRPARARAAAAAGGAASFVAQGVGGLEWPSEGIKQTYDLHLFFEPTCQKCCL